MKASAIIVAAGSSERFGGDTPKQFCEIGGRPLLSWTISRFERAGSITQIVLVTAADRIDYCRDKVVALYHPDSKIEIVAGGATRQESVLRGLEALPETTELVAIHDGARPLVDPHDIDEVVEVASKAGAALLVGAVTDTIKRASDGVVEATLKREYLYRAQTPQVFRYELIREAHTRAAAEGVSVTDDIALIESDGTPARIVVSSSRNLKVTAPEDLEIAAFLLRKESNGQQ